MALAGRVILSACRYTCCQHLSPGMNAQAQVAAKAQQAQQERVEQRAYDGMQAGFANTLARKAAEVRRMLGWPDRLVSWA